MKKVLFSIGVVDCSLQICLVCAKLAGAVDWDWALVWAPLWGSCFLTALVMMVMFANLKR